MSGAHEVIRPKQNIKKAMYKQKWNYAKKKKMTGDLQGLEDNHRKRKKPRRQIEQQMRQEES